MGDLEKYKVPSSVIEKQKKALEKVSPEKRVRDSKLKMYSSMSINQEDKMM